MVRQLRRMRWIRDQVPHPRIVHLLAHGRAEPLPFDARKGVDILPKIMTFVDRVQGALEAVRRRLPLALIRSYDVGLRRIRVLLEVLDGVVAAPLAADGPRSTASLAPLRETRRPLIRHAVRRVRFVSRCHHVGRVVCGSAHGRQTTGSSTCLPAFGAVLGSGSSPWPLWLFLGGCPSSCAAMALALPRALPRGVPKAPRPMSLWPL